jgi:uncharacterized protein (DUF58 family)
MRPTARGYGVAAVVVTLLVVAVATGSPGPLPVAAALVVAAGLATVLVAAQGRRARTGVRVHARVRPGLVPVGGQAWLEVTVANAATRRLAPVWVQRPDQRWVTNPPPGWSTAPTEGARAWRIPAPAELARIDVPEPGRGATTAAFAIPTGRRAAMALGPLRMFSVDPLGLVGMAVAATGPVTAIVHPRPAAIPAGLVTNSIGPAATTAGAGVTHRGTGDWGGDFAELRPYVVGDRLSLVHWQALARYGVTLVRQFEPEASGLVRLVVDDRAGAHHRHTYEDALSTALGLIEASVAAGLPVELSTFSGRRATIAPSPEGVAGVLELLATMAPRPSSEWSHLDLLVSEFGGFTIVTTATGAPRLPEALARRAQVVTQP